MRTNPEVQQLLYNWVSLRKAAASLGVSEEHALALGKAGEITIADLRLPGSKKGVYRVDPESVEAFRLKRLLGQKVA